MRRRYGFLLLTVWLWASLVASAGSAAPMKDGSIKTKPLISSTHPNTENEAQMSGWRAYRQYQRTHKATPEQKALIEDYLRNLPPHRSHNPLDNTGGPDGFGYHYVDSQTGDTATYAWIELCSDVNATDGPVGDEGTATVHWSWSFPFYGHNYTSALVGTNGWLVFGSTDIGWMNSCPFASASPTEPLIAVNWDDLEAGNGGGCHHDGTAPWIRWRDFGSYVVIEWSDVRHYAETDGHLTFEAILFPNGKIKLQYNSMVSPSNANSASIGIDAPGSDSFGLEYLNCDATTLPDGTSGLALWFYSSTPPSGRCCYGNPSNPTCANDHASDCVALGGNWARGETCESSPCPVLQQGETCESAYPISSLPFTATGSTVGRINDYDEMCSFLGSSASPDVVYSYVPSTDQFITISLCQGNTDYYTRLYVYQDGVSPGTPYACNDFACNSPVHDGVSKISCLQVYAGHSYCIVVDGRNDDAGTYQLDVFPSACVIQCQPTDIIEQAEPTDSTNLTQDPNGGCSIWGWSGGDGLFETIQCGQTICGRSFTYIFPSDPANFFIDVDWYRFDLTDSTTVMATLSAAFPAEMQIFRMTDCNDQSVLNDVMILAYDTTAVTTECLGAGSYAILVMPAAGPLPVLPYRLSMNCTLCGTRCIAPLRATAYRIPPTDSIRVRWVAPQTVGTYKVWATTNPQNDGNPDGGTDPNWVMVATVPGPAVAPFNMQAMASGAASYQNFVVTHDCTPIPPPNDNCAGALSLTGAPLPIIVNGNTSLAANDYNCQGLGASRPICWMGYYDQDVSCSGPDLVYDWIAPESGTYSFSLCGSSYDTGILIYNYTCPTEPTNPNDYICGNDDYCGGQSTVSELYLAQDQHILIVVDGWAGSSGAFTLTISQP